MTYDCSHLEVKLFIVHCIIIYPFNELLLVQSVLMVLYIKQLIWNFLLLLYVNLNLVCSINTVLELFSNKLMLFIYVFVMTNSLILLDVLFDLYSKHNHLYIEYSALTEWSEQMINDQYFFE